MAALRASVAAVGIVAPQAAGRLVLQLFRTPALTARRASRRMPAELSWSFQSFEEGQLAVWSLGDGPVVVLAHGWAGSSADLVPLAGVLRRAGFRAVGFDMPAHGRSTGHRTDLPQMSRALRAVADSVSPGRPVAGAIGHSLGAAAVTLALRDGLGAVRAVLVSPPAAADVYLNRLAVALRLSARVRSAALQALAEAVGGDTDLVSAAAVARTLGVPSLVVHDRHDREVAWEEGRAIADAWPGAQLYVTEHLGHRRLLSNGDVLERVLDFVTGDQLPRRSTRPRRDSVIRPSDIVTTPLTST